MIAVDERRIVEMPPVAYSLRRWSDPTQSKGHSQERQDDFAERWCHENGARLDDSMCMILDGQSAFRGNHRRHSPKKLRPLADFLDAIKTGRVSKGSILVMENIDRLSREEIDEAWELFRGILKAGVDVVTETPARRYNKQSLNDLFSILEVKFCMYRAHEESLMKSKRVRAAWEKKKRMAAEKREPVSQQCPAWLCLRDGKYRLLSDRVRIVKRIFTMAIDGLGSLRIARQLTDEAIPCFGRDGKWTPQYIRRILHSRATYGAYAQGTRDFQTGKQRETGEVVADFYPAILKEEEWLAAQQAVRQRYRTSGRPGEGEANLFTGLVYDAISGERMQKDPCWVDGVKYEYLIAPRANKKIRLPYLQFEAGIVRTLGELREEDVLPPDKDVDAQLRQVSELTREVLALADRKEDLERELIDTALDKDLLPSIKKGIIEINRRHAAKAKELRELEERVQTNRTKSLGACQSALSLLDTPERRRSAKVRIRQLVESIWVVSQPLNRACRILHVHIYLRGGRRIYRQFFPPRPPSKFSLWQLADCDFRAGDVGDAATKT